MDADGLLEMFHCPYEGCSQVYVALSSFQVSPPPRLMHMQCVWALWLMGARPPGTTACLPRTHPAPAHLSLTTERQASPLCLPLLFSSPTRPASFGQPLPLHTLYPAWSQGLPPHSPASST